MEPFFGLPEVKRLYNGFDGALYGNGMIDKGEIREEYGPFSQFQEPAQWAEISGFWTTDETEIATGEAIRYFEFSEPIGGGGGGGGALFVPYRKMEGIEAYNSVMESMPSRSVQPNRSYWRKSLNYGKNSGSVFAIPSQTPENTGFSGLWGGFSFGN